jgi:ABC-type sugar transport system substrate-binding protein
MKLGKKLLALVLAIAMVMSIAVVASAEDTKEFKHFTVGMLDMGAWNATSGPQYAQVELAAEALNVDLVYTAYDSSAEGLLQAIQNLIGMGVDAILLQNGPLVYGCIPQVAEICDDAEVYWALCWTKIEEGDGNYEACMESEYFVATFWEDDVHSGQWCTELLGAKGHKNLAEIGFVTGNATADMRDSGVAAGLETYPEMEIKAEERDQTLTSTSDGGKTIMDRFITSVPDMDGLLICGMSQFVLSGVVSSLEEHNLQDKIDVACIDFHEYQTEYLKSGVLDGIIGGHVVGPYYGLILIANIMNGTPLTDEKLVLQDNFIELASYEDAVVWDTYGKPGQLYSAEETQNMVANPDFTYEDFLQVIADYSLDDIVARAEATK